MEINTDLGYAYFPLTVGQWIIYDVDSTFYDNSTKINVIYQRKEIIESTYIDTVGNNVARIERYIRLHNDTIPYDQIPWEITNVRTAYFKNTFAVSTEDNQSYMRLVFRPQDGKKWNGNVLNSELPWTYEYLNVDAPLVKVFSFDSTLTVAQSGLNDAIINTQLATEIYAKNIGLIYKRYESLKATGADTLGSFYTMVINNYSH